MITLYDYWRSSASYRVRIALGLAGLDWETVPVDLLAAEHKAAAHLARNPQGLVPALEIDGQICPRHKPDAATLNQYPTTDLRYTFHQYHLLIPPRYPARILTGQVGQSYSLITHQGGSISHADSQFAPHGPCNRSCPKPRTRLRCAKSISTFFRSFIEISYCLLLARSRATFRASVCSSRVLLRASALGQYSAMHRTTVVSNRCHRSSLSWKHPCWFLAKVQ